MATSENADSKSNPDGQDLPDSPRDKEELKPETAIIDLPDVKDIPGQEFIHPAPPGELADTTIASDDEEGTGLLDDDEEEVNGPSDLSEEEKRDLQRADEDSLRKADMDNEDNEGVPLNEEGFGEDVSGNDLDIPGADADDAEEESGSEDEENNVYSASDENNDNVSNENS